MKTFELTPIDSRKSFYKKCRVEIKNNISTLISYDTKVAQYNHKTNEIKILKGFDSWTSKTTNRHINAFLSYYGFDTCSKKELSNYNK